MVVVCIIVVIFLFGYEELNRNYLTKSNVTLITDITQHFAKKIDGENILSVNTTQLLFSFNSLSYSQNNRCNKQGDRLLARKVL